MPGEINMEAVELITVGEVQAARRKLSGAGTRQHSVLSADAVRVAGRRARNFARHRTFVSSLHKNIAYRPAADKVTGFDPAAVSDPEKLRGVMRPYSERALAFLWKLLPRYMEKARIDFASFRPQEEEGRDLPTKKRNDLLHVDAFPTRPTRGDMILRFFTNIHQTKPRVWITSDPMGTLAPRYARDAGLSGGEASQGVVRKPGAGRVWRGGSEAVGI